MGKFLAEVWYQVENNQIEVVRSSKSMICLEPSLAMVDLSDICH
ncbi:hypothetical protein [Adhaeribacter aerolatus]|nr:hypothetical protein [Adhaeribacter aerolatus]